MSTGNFLSTSEYQSRQADSFPGEQLTHSTTNPNKLSKIYEGLKPLTTAYTDSDGRRLQLWKTSQYGLVGAVFDRQNRLYIIPGEKIRNPLNDQQPPSELMGLLENLPNLLWDITYDTHNLALTIWPHLQAAGKEDVRPLVTKKLSQLHSAQQHAVKTRELPDGRIRYYEKEIPSRSPGPTRGASRVTEHNVRKGTVHTWHESYDHSGNVNRVHPKEINGKAIIRPHYPPTEKELARMVANKQATPSSSRDPATQDFQQKVQQTGLVRSYNSTNPDNPMPEKGMTGGEIGGVACSTSYIEGLFDGPGDLFLDHHFFCFPAAQGGEVPFSDAELQQILRELAIGIYTHNTIPFFSLHFREQGTDLFPVIHPAYENTLVGRVIGMLDYIMKGYLNGGTYQENFIDDWYKRPDWETQSESSLRQLIEFTKYCQEQMVGEDKRYIPLAGLSNATEADAEASGVLRSFKGFRNSFRIIAKQTGLGKEGTLLIPDSDFDVFYDIQPSPEYQQALEEHTRKHGSPPASHAQMEQFYRLTTQRIHDHMAKMPLCRKYFSMLATISFFASYFSTLKQQRKVPCFSAMQRIEKRGCPPLFPHLPVTERKIITITLNLRDIGEAVLQKERAILTVYLREVFEHVARGRQQACIPAPRARILTTFTNEGLSDAWKRAGKIGQRILQSQEALRALIVRQMEPVAAAFLDAFEQNVRKTKHDLDARPPPGYNQRYQVNSIYDIQQNIIDSHLAKLSTFPNAPASVAELSDTCTVLPSERERNDLAKANRVVGGCGLLMQQQRVQPSVFGEKLILEHSSQLLALEAEKWLLIDQDGPRPQALFRLFFEDLPASAEDDFTWMEASLTDLSGQSLEVEDKRLQLQKAMQRADLAAFHKHWAPSPVLLSSYDLQGRTLLHHAASLADPVFAKTLLEAGCSSNVKDVHGYLPVHYAAVQPNTATLEALFQTSLMNTEAKNGTRPLSVAILHHNEKAVDFLLRHGATLGYLSGGYTDLHSALHEGVLPIINKLLDSSASRSCLNVNSIEGGTPLMLACELESLPLVQKLVLLGADPKIARHDGMTAIEIAIRRNSTTILAFLLTHTQPSLLALEVAAREGSSELLEILGQKIYSFVNVSKDNAIHVAIRNGNLDAARQLIQNCRENTLLTAVNVDKDTPFSLASGLGAWELIEALIAKGVRVGEAEFLHLLRAPYDPMLGTIFAPMPCSPIQLQKYLLIAAQVNNHRAIVELFLPRGAKLEVCRGPKGWEIVHYLAKSDGIFLFRLVMEHEEDLRKPLPEDEHLTLAAIAARYGSKRILHYLLEKMKRQDISLSHAHGDRHLLYDAIEGGVEDLLLQDHVHAVLDGKGRLASHVAAWMGATSTLEKLASYGAGLSHTDMAGWTPLDYAVRADATTTVTFLLGQKVPVTGIALFLAASHGKELLSSLLSSQPSQEALTLAIQKAEEAHNMPASRLLRNSPQKEAPIQPEGQALVSALLAKNDPMVLQLLHSLPRNAPLTAEVLNTKVRGTPTQLLVRFGQDTIVQSWLKEVTRYRDFNPNVTDDEGNTLAHLLLDQKQSPARIPDIDLRKANHKGKEPLHLAAEQDNPLLLKEIWDIVGPLALESTDVSGRSPLFLAIASGHEANVDFLLEQGANVHHTDYQRLSPLAIACAQGSFIIMQKLLRAGADPDQRVSTEQVTPTLIAAVTKHPLLVQYLLAHGANVFVSGKNGVHLIHALAESGQDRLIRLLVAKGVSPSLQDGEGKDAKQHATLFGQTETLRLLTTLEKSSMRSEEGATLLGAASARGHADAVQWLLKQGADPAMKLDGKLSSFTLAAIGKASPTILPLFQDFRVSESPAHLREALQGAITIDNLPSTQALFGKGIGIDADLIDGYTGLQLACTRGSLHCTQWLLNQGANPLTVCSSGATSLELAAANSSPQQFRLLLEFVQPDLNAKYFRGETLAHVAAKSGNLHHLSLLIAEGVDLDATDDAGSTPLYRAAEVGHEATVRLLLVCNADSTIRSRNKALPIEVVPQKSVETIRAFEEFAHLHLVEKETSLHRAVRTKSLFAVELLASLLDEQTINQRDAQGCSALCLALEMKQKNMVLSLLLAGAKAEEREDQLLKILFT